MQKERRLKLDSLSFNEDDYNENEHDNADNDDLSTTMHHLVIKLNDFDMGRSDDSSTEELEIIIKPNEVFFSTPCRHNRQYLDYYTCKEFNKKV